MATLKSNGAADVTLCGRYKFDRLVDPKLFSLTGQVDVVLPTSNSSQPYDPGRFGAHPLGLAYKDLGRVGPGRLGESGELGCTISGDADVRYGVAGTYELDRFVAVLELTGIAGSNYYGSFAQITPGLVWRGLDPFEVAASASAGIGSDAPDWSGTAKVTYALAN